MKNNITLLYSFLFIISIMTYACNKNVDSNRVYFKINPHKRSIIIPVQLNDSVKANMLLDTGMTQRTIELDSSWIAGHPDLMPNVLPSGISLGGSAWWPQNGQRFIQYENMLQTMKIGNTNIPLHSRLGIMDSKKAFQDERLDGMFNIPENDTVNVWEFNFEHNYLEIHSAESFKMPKNCLLCPIVVSAIDSRFYIQIPMRIKCAEGDTLTINHLYLVDSGMSNDIAIKYPAEELDFFNKRKDGVWTRFLNRYYQHYTVSATLFDNFTVDSLRIYTFDYRDSVVSKYLIGLNFLKRFNVFFDMKNRQIGLQPAKNFQRVVNPDCRRFYYSTDRMPEGKYIVKIVGNYEKNYYKTAGLTEGDEILAVDGKSYKNIGWEEEGDFCKRDTLLFDIIRNGKPMQIVVRVDKTEEQGD